MMKYLDYFDDCPMCSAPLEKAHLEVLSDPSQHLKRQLQLHLQEEEDTKS
jgi:hypothetical protein